MACKYVVAKIVFFTHLGKYLISKCKSGLGSLRGGTFAPDTPTPLAMGLLLLLNTPAGYIYMYIYILCLTYRLGDKQEVVVVTFIVIPSLQNRGGK